MSFGIEIVLASVGGILGVSSVIKSITNMYRQNIEIKKLKITLGDGQNFKIASDVSDKDLEELLVKLRNTPDVDIVSKVKESHSNGANEGGFVTSEFLMYFVPGIIAIAFAGTFIYLTINNQGLKDYAIPKELSTAMTTIIGYFFGVGVSNATNKSPTLTTEDIRRIINEV